MRKKLCAILSFALCGAFALLAGCDKGKTEDSIDSTTSESNQEISSSEDGENSEEGSASCEDNSEEEEEIFLVYNAELGEYFTQMANGNALYVNTKATVYTATTMSGTIIGEADEGEIVIDGTEYGATLTATGGGVGSIQPAEGCNLVFKNLTIKDNSTPNLGDRAYRRDGYLEFGGKIRFENCTFACAVYLCDDADVEFVNCQFDSGAENMYAMWISDGSASFKNCEFTGWRAIKLYEGSDNKYTSVQDNFDVESVVIDSCLFNGLKKKPGIAIDVFQGKATSLTIKNSEFKDCKEWSKDSYEGLLSVYESDVDTSTITLVMENVISMGLEVDWEMDREFGDGAPNA